MAACRAVKAPEPSFRTGDTVRNYEIEGALEDLFGTPVVITSWCTCNGFFCLWADHCPREALVSLLELWESVPDDPSGPLGYDLRYFRENIRSKIAERFGPSEPPPNKE